MGWFKRKPDPISERAKDLTRQIEQIESQIRSISTKPSPPSPLSPPGRGVPHASPSHRIAASTSSEVQAGLGMDTGRRGPEFEAINQQRLKDLTTPAPHLNELGIRRYDLPAAWRRLMNHVRGPASTNPKLVDLLAAGSLQGMRPLRYEKRIARNRFLLFVALLVLLLWGMCVVFLRGN